ncbi:MAG: hypothetical protein P8163_03650 [Candidatus Thiodiazotropha sp.]
MNGNLHLPCVSLGGNTLYDVDLCLQTDGNLRFAVNVAVEFTPIAQSKRNCATGFANGEANISCQVAMDVALGFGLLVLIYQYRLLVIEMQVEGEAVVTRLQS